MSFADDPYGSPQRSRCSGCAKTSSQVPNCTLRRCARCLTTSYCSRICLVTDWPEHRRICCMPGPTSTHDDLLAMTDSKAWLSSLPDLACVEAVIDAYRLRLEDEFLLPKKAQEGTVYAGDYPLVHFKNYLEMAVGRGGLPRWWGKTETVDCLAVALDEERDTCILHRIGAADMVEKWGTPVRVNALRMVGDRAYGGVVEFSAVRFKEVSKSGGLVARGLGWLFGQVGWAEVDGRLG